MQELSTIDVGSWKMIKIGTQFMHLMEFSYQPTVDGLAEVELVYLGSGPTATRLQLNHLAYFPREAVESCLKQLEMLGARPVGAKTP